ncbi:MULTISPECIES: hypothetical protein [unclassified Archaeoglobus]|jgi:hypothetical protein|uniref:hypothetical protein n=1 Tax=unclassified Archaeoglobus TaxID=2643606 RepID=UPI0025BA5D5D|nr:MULTISPECIES: hypothetical protein [unclassified Archaeoglobus]
MRARLITALTLIFFGLLLLTITPKQFSTLVHNVIYFCCGGAFGVGTYLLSFKAEKLRKFSPERLPVEFLKLVLTFVILLSPVYVIPLYYTYMYDNFTLLLMYISGTLTSSGFSILISVRQEKEILEPTNEFKLVIKYLIILITSVTLFIIGGMIAYTFYSTNLVILGLVLIFCGLVFLFYAIKTKNTVEI